MATSVVVVNRPDLLVPVVGAVTVSNTPVPVVVDNPPGAPVPVISALPPIFKVGAFVIRGNEGGPNVVRFRVGQIEGEWAFLQTGGDQPPFQDAWFHIPSTSPWMSA